ncbi:MAG: hypothetical protein QOF98_796, partial [Streptomyces sp.]|nr:hypothetical protein [Streptomyces sp.]
MLTGIPGADASVLADDLRALGFQVAEAPTPAAAAALLASVPAAEPVAVVDRRFVGHRHALRLALTDPRFDAAAIPGALLVRPAVRPALARVLDAATPAPAATSTPGHGRTGGAAGPSSGTEPAPSSPEGAASPTGQTSTLAAAQPARARVPLGTEGRSGPGNEPLPDLLAAALETAGTPVHRPELGVLVAAVPVDEAGRAAVRAAAEAVDEEAVRLRGAVKSRDGFFTTHFVSPYSRYLARWCARRGLTPNQVTTASLAVALVAAGCAATGTRGGYVAAGVLLLASFVLDCTDGQLARYSLQYSTLGA